MAEVVIKVPLWWLSNAQKAPVKCQNTQQIFLKIDLI